MSKTRSCLRKALCGVLAALSLCLNACGNPEPPAQPVEEPPEQSLTQQAEQPPEEPDVTEELPPEPQIEYLQHSAYMQGGHGFFYPDHVLSRAEAAQLLLNLYGPGAETGEFADVPADAWYAGAAAVAAGYLPGDEEGNFRPEEPVTPEELVRALMIASKIELPPAAEAEPVEGEEQETLPEVLRQAIAAGWLDEETAALPELTRARTVVLLNHVLGRTPDQTVLDGVNVSAFVDVPKDHPAYYEILEATLEHEYILEQEKECWNPEGVESAVLQAGVYRSMDVRYFVSAEGTVITQPGLYHEGEATYLIAESGQLCADDALHLCEEGVVFATKDGPILKNEVWGEYQFDENGLYTSGDTDLDAYVAEVLATVTTDDMDREEKLRACFNYVRDFKYLGRNAVLPSTCKTMPMENAVAYANKIFSTGKGDCYNFTAAFCFLARALGYEATAIVGYCGYFWSDVAIAHGWVEIVIDGSVYVFDPQIENFNVRGGLSNETYGAYQVTYGTAHGNYYKN